MSSSASKLLCRLVGTRKRHGKPICPRTRYVPDSTPHIHTPAYSSPHLVIQELGREGIFPLSGFLSSNKPFNTPFAGLFTQYIISCGLLFVTPPGDGFLFLLSRTYCPLPLFLYRCVTRNADLYSSSFKNLVGAYCVFIVNTLVSIGLLLIHVKGYNAFEWDPPVRTPRFIVIAYFVSNILLLVAPFIPPGEGRQIYENLPYWVSKRRSYAFLP